MPLPVKQHESGQEAEISERCEHLLEILTVDARIFDQLHDRNNRIEEEDDRLGLVGRSKDLVDEVSAQTIVRVWLLLKFSKIRKLYEEPKRI